MKVRDLIDLTVLAALWGASFLMMRISVPEFGAMPLIELRVAIAALVLSPFLVTGNGLTALRENWQPILVLGIVQAALPFCLLAFATRHLSAGFVAIANASSPLFASLIALAFTGDTMSWQRALGLTTGFVGVMILLAEKVTLQIDGSLIATVSAVTAAACYGLAAVYSRAKLARISPLTVAAGSQLAATLALLLPAAWFWPERPVSGEAWTAVAVLGVVGTGLAFTIYFRLIARVGPTDAVMVTYLIPVFAVLWGSVILAESVTSSMLLGGAVILLGTAVATGLLGGRMSMLTRIRQ